MKKLLNPSVRQGGHHDKADARMLTFLVENAERTDGEMVDKRAAVTTLLNTAHVNRDATTVATLASAASDATPWYTTQGVVKGVVSALEKYYKPAA